MDSSLCPGGAATFFVGRHDLSDSISPAIHVDGDPTVMAPKVWHAHAADGDEPQVSEVSAADVKDHDGEARVHEI